MSLKINESTQAKAKSLSDLFGDNLTEAGRADLEWAADHAAQELTMVIFSEQRKATEIEASSATYQKYDLKNIKMDKIWTSNALSTYKEVIAMHGPQSQKLDIAKSMALFLDGKSCKTHIVSVYRDPHKTPHDSTGLRFLKLEELLQDDEGYNATASMEIEEVEFLGPMELQDNLSEVSNKFDEDSPKCIANYGCNIKLRFTNKIKKFLGS